MVKRSVLLAVLLALWAPSLFAQSTGVTTTSTSALAFTLPPYDYKELVTYASEKTVVIRASLSLDTVVCFEVPAVETSYVLQTVPAKTEAPAQPSALDDKRLYGTPESPVNRVCATYREWLTRR